VNSGTATGGRGGAEIDRGLRWSRAGGIERAGTASATRAGATCLVGSGDGIGALRTGTTTVLVWVDRAGVEALARVTRALVRVGLAFTRLCCFAVDLFAIDLFAIDFFTVDLLTVDLRAVERALPLTFRCDAAAFNCFPLFGLWPRRTRATRMSS
jgi:hypothetical protein